MSTLQRLDRAGPGLSPQRREKVTTGLPVLGQHLDLLWAQKRLLLAAMTLGLLLGAGWAATQPVTYSATASLLLAPVPSYATSATTGRSPSFVSIDTDAQLVASSAVVAAVARTDPSGSDVADRLSVTATPLTRVLHITYTSETATAAAAGAEAAADAFIAARRRTLGALAQPELSQLSLRIADLEERLGVAQRQGVVVLDQDPVALQLVELRDRLAELERLRATPAELLRRPVRPSSSDPRNTELPLASGAMSGLALGWGLAGMRQRRSRKASSTTLGAQPGSRGIGRKRTRR